MIDMAQADNTLRKVYLDSSNLFYVVDINTHEVIASELSHDRAIRVCLKDFNNRQVLKGGK
jgi:hypothetical protein